MDRENAPSPAPEPADEPLGPGTHGPDGHGPDADGPDAHGSDGQGSAPHGPDAHGSDGQGSAPHGPDAHGAPAVEVGPSRGGGLSRRDLLKAGAVGAVGLASAGGALGFQRPQVDPRARPHTDELHSMGATGRVENEGFDPIDFLTHFDYGRTSTLPDGRTLREYEITAVDQEIEVAPGVHFAAWTYNGTVPGPTIRCTEGDRLRIRFANAGSHPHTIHFHGIHAADMDGVFEIIEPGDEFVYEFDAAPAGLHLYHCHAVPLKRHIHKGLYGTFIVDPADRDLPPANEMVMVMNGFDTNFDGDNEVYAVNTVAFAYQHRPIPLQKGELNRLYLVNVTEFDPINSFHLHGNFFRLHRTGTDWDRWEWTDTVMLCQGERAVLEFTYDHPGPFMFHAHQSEFAELGWMGIFDVKEALRV